MRSELKKTKAPKTPGDSARKPDNAAASKAKGKRFVLLIGDEGAILVLMAGNKVLRRLFAPSVQPSHTEAMLELLNANGKAPISILVDSMDQQFVRQTFPPVSSFSVQGLVKRRLERDFQPEDLKGSLPLGREKTGRKEWNFLLISLAKTALLSGWIELVSELPNRFEGIFLVPVETSTYTKMLNQAFRVAAKPWQLVVSHNKVSGFRQVVTLDGKLIFTRVTQIVDDAIPAVIAGNIEQEIINTVEYLRRLSFTDAVGLDIFVIASQEINDALDLKRFQYGHTQALTPLDIADALGLEQAALSADRYGDVVLSAAFMRAKKHTLCLSTAYLQSLTQLYQIRTATKALAAVFSLALLALSALNVSDILENQAATEKSQNSKTSIQADLASLKGKVAGLDKDLTYKSMVVSAHDAYLKDEALPFNFIEKLMPLMKPEVRLISLDWVTAAADATPSTSSQGNGAAPTEIKAVFEFTATYNDLDTLTKAAKATVDSLTSGMDNYTVTADPFPWQKGSDKGLEISFDKPQQTDPSVKEEEKRISVRFKGPNKTAAAAPAPAAAPASAPASPPQAPVGVKP